VEIEQKLLPNSNPPPATNYFFKNSSKFFNENNFISSFKYFLYLSFIVDVKLTAIFIYKENQCSWEIIYIL